ncbi:hypothetical protein SB18R_03365 [Pseudomonas oryzihabitans]|nr:hypothetical protein SB9_12600 [Pseudomonas psychrotolerans]KTT78280.1 hypothetical protein SB18R_03365 [Pseudomonas psychrotolerans]
MTAVVVSRKLTLLLESQNPGDAQELADEFLLWKKKLIGPGDTFGKSSLFGKPASVVRLGLAKVHLESDAVTANWDYLLSVKKQMDPDKYTSDRVLVYGQLGDMPRQPYFLLTILEPGHEYMEDPDLVKQLAPAYEKERDLYGKTLADPNWVTAGFY